MWAIQAASPLALTILAISPGVVVGFEAPLLRLPHARCLRRPWALGMSVNAPHDRRSLMKNVAAGILGSVVAAGAGTRAEVVTAAEMEAQQGPVAVVGAGGKTGRLAVEGLLRRGNTVRAVTRTGEFSLPQGAQAGLTTAAGDVTKIDTLKQALAGCRAVLFCASASKKGGNAEAVDYRGVTNTAKACIELAVPRLIVISSGAVTKPDSIGYKVTNLFGNIMTLKRKSEIEVEDMYANAPKGVTYTIVRPGGLTDGPVIGPKGIELNQGDTIGGTVNRADVAEVVVEAALSTTTENMLFEVYDKSTSGPLQGSFPKTSGYERNGDSYQGLFQGLQAGVGA